MKKVTLVGWVVVHAEMYGYYMQVFAKWYSYKDESDKPLLAHKGPYSRPISRKASGVCGALHFHCTLHTSNNCKQYHQSKYDRNDIWAIQGCQTEEDV